VSVERPERGGAWDFRGRLHPEYSPRRDGDPDPGEVVWTWVPFEEDPTQGKDRPVVVIGRDADDHDVLVALMLSSRSHEGDRDWLCVGSGGWDPAGRESWARLDRPLAVTEAGVRREGAVLPERQFLAVVEAAGRRAAPTAPESRPAHRSAARPSLLSRVRSLFRH
jgi:hypothetical protein